MFSPSVLVTPLGALTAAMLPVFEGLPEEIGGMLPVTPFAVTGGILPVRPVV